MTVYIVPPRWEGAATDDEDNTTDAGAGRGDGGEGARELLGGRGCGHLALDPGRCPRAKTPVAPARRIVQRLPGRRRLGARRSHACRGAGPPLHQLGLVVDQLAP